MKRLAIEYWTPLILWLVVIFFFSTDTFSANATSRIIVPILRFFFPSLSSEQIDFWHGVIRKLGHITEYFVLAFLTYRSFRQDQFEPTHAKVRALSFVVLTAMSDELHQLFTFFRTASPLDIGYDSFGAVCGLWLIATYETRRLRTHSVL